MGKKYKPRWERRSHKARRQTINLQERDLDVMETLYYGGAAELEQLRRLHFHKFKNRETSRVCTQDRLNKLFDYKFLDKRFYTVKVGEGRSPTIFINDRQGYETVVAERITDRLGYETVQGHWVEEAPRWRGNMKPASGDNCKHTTGVMWVYTRMVEICRQYGYQLQWMWEKEFRQGYNYDYVTLGTGIGEPEQVPVLPDAYFVILADKNRYAFFLEFDNRTETIKPGTKAKSTGTLTKKFKAYLKYYRTGKYTERFATRSVNVLTVVQTNTEKGSQRRAKRMRQQARELDAIGWFWFTPIHQVKTCDPLHDPIWLHASKRREQPNWSLNEGVRDLDEPQFLISK